MVLQHLLIIYLFFETTHDCCVCVLKIISIMKLLSLFTSRHFLYFPPEKRIVYDIYHFMLVSSNSQSLLNQRKGNKENILGITFILKYFLLFHIYVYIQAFSFLIFSFRQFFKLNFYTLIRKHGALEWPRQINWKNNGVSEKN